MKRSLIAGGALLLVALTAPLQASTFIAMSDAELVAQSDAIIVGEILDTHAYWNREGSMIFTEAVVYVHEVLVGDAPAMLNVRSPGGTVADYRVEAHGFPTFAKNQRQLLYVQRGADGAITVTGFQLGQFSIVRRSDGVEIAVPALRGVRLLTATGQPAAMPRALPLEDLKASILAVAASRDRQPLVK